MHQRDEAAVEVGAFLPAAKIAARVELGPRGGAFRERFDFRAIA